MLLTLVMPVYNEGDSVIPVISTLFLTARYPIKIFVVHDSPDDLTVAEAYRGISARIEDTVLITATGTEVLSRNLPIEIAEIEAAMK